MPTLADARRWLVDQVSHDEQINGSPKPIIRETEKRLDQMNAGERTRTLEHLKAYSTLYYTGRHRENVPTEVQAKFRQMEQRVNRLNEVDKARQIVQQYGGPPTKQTVLDSLSRTYQQRVKDYHLSKNGLATNNTTQNIGEQFQQGYKQRMNLLDMEFNLARRNSNEPESAIAQRIVNIHNRATKESHENNSNSNLSWNTSYFNFGQRAAVRDWSKSHNVGTGQSQAAGVNSSQEQKNATGQQASQQAVQSNTQANSSSTDQAQKVPQVQRDFGMSY